MEPKNKVAIFTIVNKQSVFEEFKESLQSQEKVNYELFSIMNCNGEYSSARKAYNERAKNRDAEYYMFIHPDVRFLDNLALARIIKWLDVIKDFGVVGVAGAVKSKNSRKILTTLIQGQKKKSVGEIIKKPEKVQTLDECLFIVKKQFFEEHPFSENNGWHLYAVEYSLNALSEGKDNYVVPAHIWHLSDGVSLDEKYMEQLEIIIKQFEENYRIIYTTVKAWPTRGLFSSMYRKYYWLKQRIKRAVIRR